jgi:hypothetical protein
MAVQEKRSAYAPSEETPVRYDGIYRIAKCWRKPGEQGFLICRYLFVRCDNEPAPWSSDGEPCACRSCGGMGNGSLGACVVGGCRCGAVDLPEEVWCSNESSRQAWGAHTKCTHTQIPSSLCQTCSGLPS